jgi:hypothetical protein
MLKGVIKMDDLDDMLHNVEQGNVSPDEASKKIHQEAGGKSSKGKFGGVNVTIDGQKTDCDTDSCSWNDKSHWKFEVTREKKPFLSGLFFGIFLILQSVVIVCYNVGLLPAAGSWWNLVWPVILFSMGAKMIVSEAIKGKFAIFGTAIMAIGVGRMLVNSALISMTAWWSWFWPIILIVGGVALLVRALIGKADWEVHFD